MESGNKNFEVKNYIQVARKVVAKFRAENVELIIAMTHQQDVSENLLVSWYQDHIEIFKTLK